MAEKGVGERKTVNNGKRSKMGEKQAEAAQS
jgi:hypothetical protein